MQHLHATFASNVYMQYFCHDVRRGEERRDFQLRSVHGLAHRQAALEEQARDAHACEVLAGRWVSGGLSRGCRLSPAQWPCRDPGLSVTVDGGGRLGGVGAEQGAAGEVNAVISRGRGSPTDEASPARWGDSSAARQGHKGGSPGSSWSQGRG